MQKETKTMDGGRRPGNGCTDYGSGSVVQGQAGRSVIRGTGGFVLCLRAATVCLCTGTISDRGIWNL